MLLADRVIYDRTKQTLRAQGNVQITDTAGATEFADEIEVDQDFTNGFATRFSTRIPGKAPRRRHQPHRRCAAIRRATRSSR